MNTFHTFLAPSVQDRFVACERTPVCSCCYVRDFSSNFLKSDYILTDR